MTVFVGLLSSVKSWAVDEIILKPSEQEAVSRLVDDYELLKKHNKELGRQNVLLAQTIELQKQQLELFKQYLEIEKSRVAFYKDLLEEERNNREVDLGRFKSITEDYKNLVEAQKPSFIDKAFPLLGVLLTVAILL